MVKFWGPKVPVFDVATITILVQLTGT